MSVETSVDELLDRCTPATVPERKRRTRIRMYAKGLKSKFAQIRFAFQQLQAAHSVSEATTTSIDEILTEEERIQFYSDCFWTFLHSAFEILGQVVNQQMKLIDEEKGVTFKTIVKEMQIHYPNDDLTDRLDTIERSTYYKNVNGYRHSSGHRRPICHDFKRIIRQITPGYEEVNATGSGPLTRTTIESILCDNPMDIKPKFKQQRNTIEYSKRALHRSEQLIEFVLNRLLM